MNLFLFKHIHQNEEGLFWNEQNIRSFVWNFQIHFFGSCYTFAFMLTIFFVLSFALRV